MMVPLKDWLKPPFPSNHEMLFREQHFMQDAVKLRDGRPRLGVVIFRENFHLFFGRKNNIRRKKLGDDAAERYGGRLGPALSEKLSTTVSR